MQTKSGRDAIEIFVHVKVSELRTLSRPKREAGMKACLEEFRKNFPDANDKVSRAVIASIRSQIGL